MNKLHIIFYYGFLWGGTNPLIKKGSQGIILIEETNKVRKFIRELIYLLTNLEILLPLLLNQLGSILFFITLQASNLSVTVPVVNSLSFAFTAISGWFLGEKNLSKSKVLGILLILSGTYFCCLNNLHV